MSKTHFTDAPFEDQYDGICGIVSENLTNQWSLVTCCKCLKRKEGYIQEVKKHLEDQSKDYRLYNEFYGIE